MNLAQAGPPHGPFGFVRALTRVPLNLDFMVGEMPRLAKIVFDNIELTAGE